MRRPNEVVRVKHTTDTLTVVQTIRDTVLKPVYVTIRRVDTICVELPGDTVRVPVSLPIEQKTYKTDQYTAVIEGFKPSLISMETYNKTQTIYKTETIIHKSKWSVGLQAGYGFGLITHEQDFYIGLGLSYRIF